MKTKVMGIINLTSDSFSGDGLYKHQDLISSARKQAERMVQEGANILDLGACSSRPGASSISPEEEWIRLQPVLKNLRELPVTISIDTYHASTAYAAIENGANWINSIWGLQKDPDLAAIIRQNDVKLVIMHNTSEQAQIAQNATIGNYYDRSIHQEVMLEILQSLRKQILDATNLQIQREKIIIDPGIGFGKTPDQNMDILRNLKSLQEFNLPILVGLSRKSFLGDITQTAVEDRLPATITAHALTILGGASILRVHDIKAACDCIKIVESFLQVQE